MLWQNARTGYNRGMALLRKRPGTRKNEAALDWESAAWWLERRCRADWGRKWRPGPSGPEVVIIRVPFGQ